MQPVARWTPLVATAMLLGGCTSKKAAGAAGDGGVTTTSSAAAAAPSPYDRLLPKGRAPTKEEGQGLLVAAIGDAKATPPNCEAIASHPVLVAFTAAAPDAGFLKANEPALVTVARCAEKIHAYRFMLSIAVPLSDANPEEGHSDLIGRALLGLGVTDGALSMLHTAAMRHPDNADVQLAIAKAHCKRADWQACLAAADGSLKLLGNADSKDKMETAWRAQKYRARALLHRAELDAASAAAEETAKLAAPASDTNELKEMVSKGRREGIVVDASFGPRISLGAYPLYGKLVSLGPAFTLTITNLDARAHTYQLDIEVPEVTERASQTQTASAQGGSARFELTPPLKPNAAGGRTHVVVHVAKVDGGAPQAIHDETVELVVDPPDALPLVSSFAHDGSLVRPVPELLGAWVTPTAPAVKGVVEAAKKRAPAAFTRRVGHGAARAIYDELKARGVSFDQDTGFFSDDAPERSNVTHLPGVVLSAAKGSALEGALLFASALEAVGLRPSVVIAPGRAFIGYAPMGSDIAFLDPTLVSTASFDAARTAGDQAFAAEQGAHHVEMFSGAPPVTCVVDVARLRTRGVKPRE